MGNEQMIKYNKFGWVNLSELKRDNNGKIRWKDSVGCKIHFKYQDIESDIVLLECLSHNSVKICVVDYVTEYVVTRRDILSGYLGKATRKRTAEFKYQIGDIVNGYLLLTSSYMNKNNKYYTYTCLNDGYNGHISEGNIKQGRGCPVCYGRVTMRGVNDIATICPDIANLLWNLEDAYIYSPGSNKKVDFRCPRCGNKISAYIHIVSYYGLSCKMCGDGISYPEKFISNFLRQVSNLHIENIQLQNFETYKTFDWSKDILHQNPKLSGNKIYDFYIPLENKIIIEAHGIQHYEVGALHTHKNSRTLKEDQENDKLKMELAISNGIIPQNYIQLDCRYSTVEHIRNSIMLSNLPRLLNFTECDINWDECNRFATSSYVFEVCELWNRGEHTVKNISNRMKMCEKTIYNYLRRGFELGVLQNPPKYLLKKLTIQNDYNFVG